MKEEVDKLLKETDEYVANEISNTPIKYRAGAVHGRSTRYLMFAENSAAEDYYKRFGRYYDNNDNSPAHIAIAARILIFILFALIANLALYLPVYYLAVSNSGEVSKYDSFYVAIIVNTAIGMIAGGIWSENGTKRQSFKAGMRAEADNSVLVKYHIAKDKIDERYVSKGNLPDFDFEWKD